MAAIRDTRRHHPVDDRCVTDTQPAEFLLDGFPPAIRETGLALRSLIFRTVPDTVETVRTGWRWIAYSLPEKGRVRNYAWIGPERKHIHLGFENGTLLADPEQILQGAQERLKKFRYVTFEPSIDIDEAILVDYILRAADLAVMPLDARRALAETAAEPIIGALGDVPADWELIDTTDDRTSQSDAGRPSPGASRRATRKSRPDPFESPG
jgi:hypothetical protein